MLTKIGQRFECIKSVYDGKFPLYEEGKIYTCAKDGCLTDSLGDISHEWTDSLKFREHFQYADKDLFVEEKKDKVNHPSHYTWLKDKCGIEVIDITRHLDFCTGNAVKYLLRAGHKEEAGYSEIQKEIEDLEKAIWYIKDRIKQLKDDKT